jgi:hypothetical protein
MQHFIWLCQALPHAGASAGFLRSYLITTTTKRCQALLETNAFEEVGCTPALLAGTGYGYRDISPHEQLDLPGLH